MRARSTLGPGQPGTQNFALLPMEQVLQLGLADRVVQERSL